MQYVISLVDFLIIIHVHDHIFYLKLQVHNFLISFSNIVSKSINLLLKCITNFVVFKVSDPVEDILFRLFFKYVLLEDFVLFLQLFNLVFVFQISLLQLEILLLQLDQQGTVHLIQSTNASLVGLNQAVLGMIKQFFEVDEVHLV